MKRSVWLERFMDFVEPPPEGDEIYLPRWLRWSVWRVNLTIGGFSLAVGLWIGALTR